jgi:regulatory protein
MGAYLEALKMLARRELSEAQVRQRLARRGHGAGEIDDAIRRLRDERAIDDARVAEAIARSQTSSKGRGRLRVQKQIEMAGIAQTTARTAVADIYNAIDPDALIAAAIAKRLRGRPSIGDQREFGRLYRYLLRQGFEADRVMRALRAHGAGRVEPSDE